jgi:ABC-type transport system substrate-binding protein
MTSRTTCAFILVSAVGLAAAGCGSTAGTAATAAGEGLHSAPAQITIGSPQKILTLDPDLAADGYSEGVLHEIGGNLYELGSDGRVFPLLVRSASVSADGLTWTFELKPGLRFSDGSPLTSADVRATFERAKRDKSNAYAGFVAPIASIADPTPTNVIFRLTRPYPSLPTVLSQPEMTILPASGLVRGSSFLNAPTSAGPYRLQSWGGSPTAVLVRNPYYAGPKPAIGKLIYTYVPDFNTRLAEVQSGQLDLALDIPPRSLAAIGSPLVASLTPHFGFVSLDTNTTAPPLDQVGVRKAISEAVNRAQIDQTAWNGRVTSIAGFWPSTMSGYDPNIPTAPNLAAARADLHGTSCAHGCSLRFLYSAADPWGPPTAAVIAQDLKAIGLSVQLDQTDDATFNQDLGNLKYQLGLSFLYDYNNVPDGMLTYAMTSNGGLNANFSGFKPPPNVQSAVTTAITRGGAARAAALRQINNLFLKYQPFVTLSTYALGNVSRYAPTVVSVGPAGFVDVADSR